MKMILCQIVLCGSGSTGVACVELNRRFCGVEIDRNFFDIAKNRIEEVI